MNDFNGNFSNNSTSNQKFAAPFTPDQLGPKVNNDVYDNVRVEIVDAVKTSEGSKSSYIAYIIHYNSSHIARRYSDFESLRFVLGRLYPTLIIPPIPSKHSIGEYANKSKEDTIIVNRRKRTLQDFLSRVAKHPILGNDQFFHKFLSPDISWKHIINSPPISTLPKNPLHAPSHDPTNDKNVAAYASLPTPSPSQPLKRPDQRFLDSEMFTCKFAQHFESSLERVDKRVTKRWNDIAKDYAEIGALLNGFSLTENDSLANGLERTGQAVDSTYTSTINMLHSWEKSYSEPLHIYTQFAGIIKKLLDYRHQKHAQYEMMIDALGAKRVTLDELERSEQEARRLDEALSRGLSSTKLLDDDSQSNRYSDEHQENNDNDDHINENEQQPSSEVHENETNITNTTIEPNYVKGHKNNLSFLGALSQSIQGMMDVDPEATRRNSIGKTREAIQGFESALEASTYDLTYTSQTIQADLDRFQRQKVADLREMCISYAQFHSEWANTNLQSWQEALKEIENIDTNLNDEDVERYAHQFDDNS